MATLNEKLNEIISEKPSNWYERAKNRQSNRKWLAYSSNIAVRILAIIEGNKEMTQKLLADKIGVTPQYVSKLLKGQENLTLETIGKISNAIGFELIEFPAYKYSTNQLDVYETEIQTTSVSNNMLSVNSINNTINAKEGIAQENTLLNILKFPIVATKQATIYKFATSSSMDNIKKVV